VLLAHVVLSPVVFSRSLAEAFETPKAMLLLSTALVLAALRLAGAPVGAAASDERHRPSPAGGLTLGIALFLTSAAASTASSISPLTSLRGAHESFAGLLSAVAYAVLFLEVRRTTRGPADAARLARCAVFAGTAAAVYALAQWAGLDPLAWERTAELGGRLRPFGTLGHPNLLGAYLAMTLPLAPWLWRAAPRRPSGLAAAAAALVGLVALAATMSRGAWLALASAILLAAVVSWRGMRPSPRAVTMALAMAAASGALAAAVGGERWIHDLAARSLAFGAGPRAEIWRGAWRAFLDRPVFGWGVDTFALTFPAYRSVAYAAAEFNRTPVKAHNDLLHLLATQGLVGLAAASVLACGLARAARGVWRAETRDRGLVLGLVASLCAWAVAGATGFTVAATGSLAAVEAGVLGSLAAGGARTAVARGWRPAARDAWRRSAVAAAAAGLLSVLVARPLLASARCREAGLRLARDPSGAALLAAEAARLDPLRDLYHARWAQAAAEAARQASSPREAVPLLMTARAAYARAVRLEPMAGHLRAGLALVEADLARVTDRPAERAWREFERAFVLDPNNALLRMAASGAALRCGDLRRARAYADEAHRLLPGFGAPLAQLGHLAAAEGRREQAVGLLQRSLALPWYGLDGQRDVARQNLSLVLRASRPPGDLAPPPP
jgi:O-antigen ligase